MRIKLHIAERKTMETQKENAGLVILEGSRARVCPLEQRERWMLGRDTPNSAVPPDIPLTSGIVSRTHAWLEKIAGEWFFVDNPQNLNGTFHNGVKISHPKNGVRVPVLLENGDILRIDNSDLNNACDNGVLLLFTTDALQEKWTAYPLEEEVTYIGRDTDGRGVKPMKHDTGNGVKLTRLNDRCYLFDSSTPSGVQLNGKPVRSGALLREKDVICVWGSNVIFLGNCLLYGRSVKETHCI